MKQKPFLFRHFAANGRAVTACGKRIQPNSDANEKQHSNGHSTWTRPGGEPTCKVCRAALVSNRIIDLVRCCEDDSDSAMDHAAQTMADAEATCARLGKGWEPRVWYNCGWHCEAVHGDLHVSPRGNRRFDAHLEPGRFWADGSTPLAAVRATLKLVTTARDDLSRKIYATRRSVA